VVLLTGCGKPCIVTVEMTWSIPAEDQTPPASADTVVLHFREAPNYEMRGVRVPGLRKHLESGNKPVVPATFDLHGDPWHGFRWFTLLTVAGIPALGAELGPYGGGDGGKEPLLTAWESKCR
jgi:hypothetical protein